MQDLQGRTVIVTGAGQGLGRAYALGFAKEGAIPLVADLNLEAAERVAGEVRARGGESLAVQVDVGDVNSVDAMVSALMERYGRIDVLVNNAAIFSTLKMKPFEEIPLDEWDRVLHVNITGCFYTARAVAPHMRGAKRGSIVNISSAAYLMGRPNYLHYTTSKAALVGMTRSLARELGRDDIRVNVVLPGAVETEIARETVSPEQLRQQIAARALPRTEEPADLVGVVLFLASDASRFVTGQSVVVDGGLTFL
jgi:3-oxoacyl-[acyl-carrier protein] reductase